MKVDITVLKNDLDKQINKYIGRKEICNNILSNIEKKFNIPTGVSADFLFKIRPIDEANIFMLFSIVYSIRETDKDSNISIETYFTELEIKKYLNTRYEDVNKWSRVELDAIQIDRDQWLCSVDIDFFIKLRRTQKINYNAATQRTMTHVVRGEEVFYQITVNKKEVEDIKESFINGNYIPNSITLNIPADTEDDFWYNESTHKLVIDTLDHFDIIDGYHRYLAMCSAKDDDPEFNHPMELRIVNFTEDKAKQFIWQEDQKTQMRKLDSKAFNMSNPANIVVERLNEDPKFNLKGCISRNNGQIPYAEFSYVIDFMFFKGISKSDVASTRMLVTKRLRDGFNSITELDDEFLSRTYSYVDLVVLVLIFKEDQSLDNLIEKYRYLIKTIEEDDDLKKRLFVGRPLFKPTIDKLSKILSEVK